MREEFTAYRGRRMFAKIPTFSFLMLGIKSILKEKRVKYFKYSVCYWAVVEGREEHFGKWVFGVK